MAPRASARESVRRVFAAYAMVSAVPVLVLGLVLLILTSRQTMERGMAQARQEAVLASRITVAPLLTGHPLSEGLTTVERHDVQQSVWAAIRGGEVRRLRIRDLDGTVVYSNDGSGADADSDDEVVEAARGQTVVQITRLNADGGDTGPVGDEVVEAYTPLVSVKTDARIGVLEIYLPYAPIKADEAGDRHEVELTLGIGLIGLWLVLLGVSMSITRRLNRQTALANRNARHDPLTGLANRGVFTDMVNELIEAGDENFIVGFLDIQGVQSVNENLGYGAGDELIIAVADRLRATLPEGAPLARAGGDKFGFITRAAVQDLEKLRGAVTAPLQIAGLPFAVQVAVGYAVWDEDAKSLQPLMSKADLAAAAAGRTRAGILRWNNDLDRRDPDALRLIGELREAIADDQLVLHLQPKAAAASGSIVGVEALVRWQHPTRGLLYPDKFLEAAERTELIDDLTRWVLRASCRAVAQLPDEVCIAVNISAATLVRQDFAAEVLTALTETGTPAGRVILEITETALIADPARAAITLGLLDGAGVRVSIDDFGAGHTSLSHLAGLPLAELKVDRSFVMAMTNDARNAAIVSSVIQLGHALGLTVVAEGVETEQAWRELERLGCDLIQGYYLARPQPLATLIEALPALGHRQPATV